MQTLLADAVLGFHFLFIVFPPLSTGSSFSHDRLNSPKMPRDSSHKAHFAHIRRAVNRLTGVCTSETPLYAVILRRSPLGAGFRYGSGDLSQELKRGEGGDERVTSVEELVLPRFFRHMKREE
jgi:hypothetical protein